MHEIRKIGHRGACGHAPENTRASFRKALEIGVDAVEFDIQLSADGKPVVIHDATLERTTNGKGKICDYSFWELQQFDAGNGERIPHLSDIFTVIDKKCDLFIELKTDAIAAVNKVILEEVKNGWNYEKIWILGFNHELLGKIHEINHNLQICASFEKYPTNLAQIKNATNAKAIAPSIDIIDEKMIEECALLDLKIFTWTANSKEEIAKAIKLGADGIISDFPERI